MASSTPTTAPPAAPAPHATARPDRTPSLALPESRWALAALLLFAAGGAAHLAGAPPWLYWTLYLACYGAGGWQPALSGLAALRERTLDVDLLMVLAAAGAASIGQIFDGALLIVIFATSGALEAIATRRTEESIRGLLTLAPDTAVRVGPGGTEETVPADDLKVGEEIIVRPGERIGADGTVLEGTGDVDQATITGEPLPTAKTPGDEVFAGTVNGNGALRVRVDRPAHDTVVARIVSQVERASATKARTQLFIERFEQHYSAVVVAATIALFSIPLLLLGTDLESALLRAMTFMIVASPCAVVLATMPPLLAAISTAGRHGVLVKNAVALERLAGTDTAALDKTGTLTTGRPRLAAIRTLPRPGAAPIDEAAALRLAAAAEHGSEHPVGRAIAAAAEERGIGIPRAEEFTALPGRGVLATVDGARVAVGALERIADPGTGRDDPRAAAAVAELEDSGHTAVAVLHGGVPVAVLGLSDTLRPDAASALGRLSELTARETLLLTGDNPRSAQKTATAAGITHVRSGLLPEGKADAIRELADSGRRVLFVGDGINDAPAMATARTGIAMGTAGADLAVQTSDAVVVRDELEAVPTVVALARRAQRLVIANLAIAGTVIVALVTWEMVWHLPLVVGVAGHELSTVLVALNGMRLLSGRAWRRAEREGRRERADRP